MASDQVDRREWGRVKGVSVVVEIRSLSQQGLNKQQIARRLGIHRETVAKNVVFKAAVDRRRGAVASVRTVVRKLSNRRRLFGLPGTLG